MLNIKPLAASILAATILLTGCANKAQTGTAIGAGIGGVACGLLTKGSGGMTQVLATAGCAAVGGFLGNQIGKSLDARDQAALAAKTQQALGNQAGTYNWRSEHSGASASIKVGAPYQKTEQVSVKRTALVQPVAKMEKLGGQFMTVKGANVRQAPTTSSGKVGFLPAATEFTAMGKTGDWIMVGRKGVAVGYIHSSLVKSKASYEVAMAKQAPVESNPRPAAQAKAEQPKVAVVVAPVVPALVLDEATPATTPEIGQLASETSIRESGVAETQTCRDVDSSVKDAKGKVESTQSSACKKADEDIWADA